MLELKNICFERENRKILDNINLKIDGKIRGKSYEVTQKGIKIYQLKRNNSEIEINYEYNSCDVTKDYSNVSVLRLIGITDKNASSLNTKIELPKETNIFEIKPNTDITYLSNNVYNVKGPIVNEYAELIIDKDIIKNTRIINEKYELSDIKRTVQNEDKSIIIMLIILAVITIINFIITAFLTRGVKIENNNYVRDPEEVIEPILAESLIDKKIGAKELIMSCIVELIYRGNLKNIGNDKIQLLDYYNTSELERGILDLLFKGKGQIITFEQIKQMFMKENNNTQIFLKKLKKIKKKIEEKLIDYNLYSKTGERTLKILRVFSGIIITCLTYILSKMVSGSNILAIIFSMIMVLAIILLVRKSNKKKNMYLFWPIIICMVLLTWLVVKFVSLYWYQHLASILIIVSVFLGNIVILIKTKSHVLTQMGRIEYSRAQRLKNYIKDYSLMEERELDSVIIWDEYLAYAVAFGIPNKITKQLNENLMKTNIVLQKIESILKFI